MTDSTDPLTKAQQRGDRWKYVAQEIEADRDRAGKARAQAERRAEIAETELRTLRSGIRALGGDPTQVQNLWAQLHMRNKQWVEAKREREQHADTIERVGAALDTAKARGATGMQYEAAVRAALGGDAAVVQPPQPDGPRCVCGDPIEPRDEVDPTSWIHSPGSDTPCLDARPAGPSVNGALRIVESWYEDVNDGHGLDAGDLIHQLEQASYPLPGSEGAQS